MHGTRGLGGLLLALALCVGWAQAAQATVNAPVGTPIAATTDPPGADTYSWDMTGFVSCEQTLGGAIVDTSADDVTGEGAVIEFDAGTAWGCNTGGWTFDFATPWTATFTPAGSLESDVHLENVRFAMVLFGVRCPWSGTLDGVYDERADTLVFSNSGGMVGDPGSSFLCPSHPAFDGSFAISPTGLDIS